MGLHILEAVAGFLNPPFPLRLCVLVGSIICDLHYTWQREQDKITVIEEDNGPYRLKFN